MWIIKQQRQLGFDILESIQIVVRLHKVMDFKNTIKNFDQDEEWNFNSKFFGSIFVIHGNIIIVIICHRIILAKMTSTYVAKVLWLFSNGVYVA
jgi:hypothetical protein